jgi:hypothetical protein
MSSITSSPPLPYGMQLPVDPAVLYTIPSWKIPRHPNLQKMARNVEALCVKLESSRGVRIVDIDLAETPESATQSDEHARYWLEYIRSMLIFIDGVALERIKRQVRRHLPQMSTRLEAAAEQASCALKESEQSLLFMLDETVEDEWLPEPAPPGAFDKDADAVSLEPA